MFDYKINMLFIFVSFVATSLAEDLKTAEAIVTYHSGPALSTSSIGTDYGIRGRRLNGYGAYRGSDYGDQGLYGTRAFTAQGHRNTGDYGAHDAYGGQAGNYGRSRNVGTYAQDKGTGYEKAYAYDNRIGNHGIIEDHEGHHGNYGVHDRNAYHDLGGYGTKGHSGYGAHDRYGAEDYGVNAIDDSYYGNYGRGYNQMYQATPPFIASYTAPRSFMAPLNGYIAPY